MPPPARQARRQGAVRQDQDEALQGIRSTISSSLQFLDQTVKAGEVVSTKNLHTVLVALGFFAGLGIAGLVTTSMPVSSMFLFSVVFSGMGALVGSLVYRGPKRLFGEWGLQQRKLEIEMRQLEIQAEINFLLGVYRDMPRQEKPAVLQRIDGLLERFYPRTDTLTIEHESTPTSLPSSTHSSSDA